MDLLQKLERGIPLRVLFVNDLGFQFGAGIAMVRQVQAFLLRGDHVMGLCSAPPPPGEYYQLNRPTIPGQWLGSHIVQEIGYKRVCSDECAANKLALEAAGAYADLILVGNIHSAHWPVWFLEPLRKAAPRMIAYMHDCYFVTGRCAYAGPCELFRTGCNETCPTAAEYPALAPELIHQAWQDRRRIFGKGGIPLVTNSRWTARFAKQAIPDARVDMVHYGIDTELFSPGDRADARRRLGIPEDQIVILSGAVNLKDTRKGAIHLENLFQHFGRQVHGIVVGANSNGIASAQSWGLIPSQRKMRLLYRAADIFINTSLDEAFGQMMLEAAACGLPIVAFNAGGVPDISHHARNALVVPAGDTKALIQATAYFMRDAAARERFGKEGRRIAVEQFSLAREAENWTKYLLELARS